MRIIEPDFVTLVKKAYYQGYDDAIYARPKKKDYSTNKILQSSYNSSYKNGKNAVNKNGGNSWTMKGKKKAISTIAFMIESIKKEIQIKKPITRRLEAALIKKQCELNHSDFISFKQGFLQACGIYKPKEISPANLVQVNNVLDEARKFAQAMGADYIEDQFEVASNEVDHDHMDVEFEVEPKKTDLTDSLSFQFERVHVLDARVISNVSSSSMILSHLQPEPTFHLDEKQEASIEEEKSIEPPLKKRRIESDFKPSATSAFHIFNRDSIDTKNHDKEERLEIKFNFDLDF